MICSPVLRNSTMLNMERMVGTITPKKVFSLRGSLLGVPGPGSGAVSGAMPHAAAVTDRPHTPEVIRGVRSLDMAAESFRSVFLPCEKEISEERFQKERNIITKL